jgi:hypothetical protein
MRKVLNKDNTLTIKYMAVLKQASRCITTVSRHITTVLNIRHLTRINRIIKVIRVRIKKVIRLIHLNSLNIRYLIFGVIRSCNGKNANNRPLFHPFALFEGDTNILPYHSLFFFGKR